MSSSSLRTWLGPRAAKLDEIEAAHAAVGGSLRGRRWATEQINHAYVVLLSSQFQGYCRDLHSECVHCFVRAASIESTGPVVRAQFLMGRRLDRGNPTSGNIGADFNRLGLDFWPEVRRAHSRNESRQEQLDRMAGWRNAIADQDFEPARLAPVRLHLVTIRGWRRTCTALAGSFDQVMNRYLGAVAGASPW